LHRAGGAGRRDRGNQPAIEQPIQLADAERAEHENRCAHTSGPQRRPFLDVRTRQQVGAGILERVRDLSRTVAVRVRFHDRDHAGHPLARLGRYVFNEAAVI